tara:strand:- start:14874 stop:15236 length:363 start_codon:yes stop_codon:yes gene_type:complete
MPIKIDNDILLSKNTIFESVNRTVFTAVGISLTLLASTQTNLYTDNSARYFIKIISLCLLSIIIVYGFFNLQDYRYFLDNYKTIDDNGIISIYTESNIIILYLFLLLVSSILVCNISMML